MLTVACDGSCLYPQGPGGWAYYFSYNGSIIKCSGGLFPTTNNRAELYSVIQGLNAVLQLNRRNKKVKVVSDSQYVINGSSIWMNRWKRNGWKTASGRVVLNRDLWQEISDLKKDLEVKWKWVRGHDGHIQNEIVDSLAGLASAAIARDHGLQ